MHNAPASDTSADLEVIFALSVHGIGIGLLFRQSESCLKALHSVYSLWLNCYPNEKQGHLGTFVCSVT